MNQTQASTTSTRLGDGLTHIVCWCDDDVSLCGLDVSAALWNEDGPECVVCADLEDAPCGRCGE